jgi:hypothetical protein
VQRALGLQAEPKHKTLAVEPGGRHFTSADDKAKLGAEKVGLDGKTV